MFTVRAKEQLEERIPVQVGTTAPGECSCAGQVGRLALYPFALFWPTKYRGEERGESEEKGRGNGQRGEREREREGSYVCSRIFSRRHENEKEDTVAKVVVVEEE